MERIKFLRKIPFPSVIAIVLFFIPFFWLKPGEIDLGGDSSRLYFYDPLTYIKGSVLSTLSPSSFGFENLNYSNLPFVILLLILKSIFSSTIVVSMVYGLSLSASFIFTYLSIKELLHKETKWQAPAVGALLYTLSPATIDGWKHVLITYNQIFLNPLMFYLLLKYFKTGKMVILLLIVFLTFLFSTNFSVGAAPPFFAFYPLSILFLILYTKFILKRKIMIKHLLFGLMLFLGVQAFHIIPQIRDILYKENVISEAIFSEEDKIDRGLGYFLAIAPNIKPSLNLLSLPQMKELSAFSKIFLVLPLLIVIGFILNKKKKSQTQHTKTIVLLGFFFVIILLFATANITDVWFTTYKELFKIPGFSMFRNFYGQWQFVFVFYYSLIFALSFNIVMHRISNSGGFIAFGLALLLLVNAKPLIKGEYIREDIWQSNNVPSVIEMDPKYEELLSFIRSLPIEGRILTLPLSDQGNQVIAGKNGGAYVGPSSISYLTDKKDFAGFDEFENYRAHVLKSIKHNELETFKRLLTTINVRYVFYNADPLIYNELPSFPYEFVRSFMPKDQNSYREFIQKLHLKEIKNIDNKFYVYELPDKYFLPQINIAEKLIRFNSGEIDVPFLISQDSSRIAIHNRNVEQYRTSSNEIPVDETLTDISEMSSHYTVTESVKPPYFGFPHASWSVKSIFYPFILLRENRQLKSYTMLDQAHIDSRVFLAEKRIAELLQWANDYWVLGGVKNIDELRSWKDPNLLEAVLFKKYNFWEVSLFRYRKALGELIEKINEVSVTNPLFSINKDRLREAVNRDRDIVYRLIQGDKNLTDSQKQYLLLLSKEMFSSISDSLLFQIPQSERISYDLSKLAEGEYEILIDKDSFEHYDLTKVSVLVDSRELPFNTLQQDNKWLKIASINFKKDDKKDFSILIQQQLDLAPRNIWKSVETGVFSSTSASLTTDSNVFEENGIVSEIADIDKNSHYILSFDYYTDGKGFKLMLVDKAKNLDKSNKRKISEYELIAQDWKKYTSIFTSNDEPRSTYFQITKLSNIDILNRIESEKENTRLDIRNLSFTKLPNPKIILRKTSPSKNNNLPKLTFTRINPTKYEVQVKNAIAPYTLVLANQFNRKWKLIDPSNADNKKSFLSKVLRVQEIILASILSKKDSSQDKEILSYFNGEIQEIHRQDTFFDKRTFETSGKKEIVATAHFPINGYSNAWYIKPTDVGNRTDYTLIIEFIGQRQFYVNLFLSVSIAFFILFFILVKLRDFSKK